MAPAWPAACRASLLSIAASWPLSTLCPPSSQSTPFCIPTPSGIPTPKSRPSTRAEPKPPEPQLSPSPGAACLWLSRHPERRLESSQFVPCRLQGVLHGYGRSCSGSAPGWWWRRPCSGSEVLTAGESGPCGSRVILSLPSWPSLSLMSPAHPVPCSAPSLLHPCRQETPSSSLLCTTASSGLEINSSCRSHGLGSSGLPQRFPEQAPENDTSPGCGFGLDGEAFFCLYSFMA